MTSTRARQIFCGRLDVGNSSGSARPVAPPPFRVPPGWRLCAKSFRLFPASDPLATCRANMTMRKIAAIPKETHSSRVGNR
jgi:hypothetical protein